MKAVWRCDVTKNPIGTDTEMIGRPCQCQACRMAGEIERMRRIEISALVYFVSYCRDEAEELECCINPEQHKAAQELRDALANKRTLSK